jgi:hypothetical protein
MGAHQDHRAVKSRIANGWHGDQQLAFQAFGGFGSFDLCHGVKPKPNQGVVKSPD